MNLVQETERLLYFLSLPEAKELKGATWCTLSALILTMTLGSLPAPEATERLTKEVAKITVALKGGQ